MGDSENALPPSKKRAAGRELTQDTTLDDEEDAPDVGPGTFKRASDEVLATRKFVKVRRQQSNSAPTSNPFAGIRLVTPTESNANAAQATAGTRSAGENTTADDSKGSDDITKDSEKAKDEEGKQPEGETSEVEDKSAANKDAAEESQNSEKDHNAEEKNNDDKGKSDNDQIKDGNKSESEDKKDTAEEECANEADKEHKDENDAENDDKKENSDNNDKKADKAESEEPNAEGGTFKSFQQLSSSQNAFTGLAGTGFNTSLFSFGSMSKDGSALSSGSGSIFGLKNDKPFGLGLSNNGSSGFGASGGASVISKSEGSGLALQEVPVETGEENEKVVFNADSVLFEFVDGSWKERGKGELKVNVNSGTEKARLLMRSRGNYRLILNACLYPDMKLANMDKKGVTFACINSATEGKNALSTFALKFKDGSTVEEFKTAIMAHKGEASTVSNTSENSPNATAV